MSIGKPKIGIFYRSAAAPANPLFCIPIQKYAEKYFMSRYQIKKLLAKKTICGVRFKKRLYIADISPEEI